MKQVIIAKNKAHLKELIENELNLNRKNNKFKTDLNHIDVSQVTDMSFLFQYSRFNGNISEWNVSNVTKMTAMFDKAYFNGDISKWDISNVQSMLGMFYDAKFNRDISKWDVSEVVSMDMIFEHAKFNQDLSFWTPYKLKSTSRLFSMCDAPIPYWAEIENHKERINAIKKYNSPKYLSEELEQELNNVNQPSKKIKI